MTMPPKNLVSQETVQKFEVYERLLREWNRRTTLVQEGALSDFDNRHILDSLQLIPVIEAIPSFTSPPENEGHPFLSHFEPSGNCWEKLDLRSRSRETLSIVDAGTGAGFPGMVLAMCGFEKVTLCESNRKKCFFLEEVARQTSTRVTIMNDRVENVEKKFDIMVSRACADLRKLLRIMADLLSSDPSSCGLFHKGRSWKEEVASAQKEWVFSGSFTQSVTSREGVILRIRHLKRRSQEKP